MNAIELYLSLCRDLGEGKPNAWENLQIVAEHSEVVVHCEECDYFETYTLSYVGGTPIALDRPMCQYWHRETRAQGFCDRWKA